MKIGIDIDNTITNTLPVLKEYCARYNDEIVCRGLRMHEDGFATYNLFDWTHEEEMDFCNKYLAEAVLRAKIKESAVEVIRRLKEEGHYIYIITARKEPHFSNPYQLTENFLDNAGIEYGELIVGCEDKCSFCIEHGIKLMMDDEPQNILSGAHVILAALKKEDIYEPEFDLLPKLNTKKSGNSKGMYITGDIKNMPIRIASRDVYYFDDNGICIKNNIDCIINEKVKEHVLKAARGKDIYALSNFRDIMGILEQELEKKIDGYTQVLFKKAASLIKEGDSIDRFAEILQNVKKEEQKSMEDIKKVISKVELPRYYWNNNNEFVGIYMYIVKNYPDAMQIIRRSKKEIIQIALEGILKYKEYRNKGLSEDNMDFLGCRFESSDMMYVEFKIKRRGA